MAYIHEQMEKLKWDKRMVNINIRRGLVSEDEIKQNRESQPDEAAKVEAFTLDEEFVDANQSTTNTMEEPAMNQSQGSPFMEDQGSSHNGDGGSNDGGFGQPQF